MIRTCAVALIAMAIASLSSGSVAAQSGNTQVITPDWSRSSQSVYGVNPATWTPLSPSDQAVQKALGLLLDLTDPAQVWDKAHMFGEPGQRPDALWATWGGSACDGVLVDLGRFHGTFTLTTSEAAAAVSARIIDPFVPDGSGLDSGGSVRSVPAGSIPVNDGVFVFVNGVSLDLALAQFYVPSFFPETGWYRAPVAVPASLLVAGTNTIDLVSFEWCGGGGVGFLSLELTTAVPDAEPIANAGGPYAVVQDQSVVLDGTASSDDNGDLAFAWSVTSAPAGSSGGTLQNAATATPSFTPDVPGEFSMHLVVTDSVGQTDAADATVSSTNVAPISNAGPAVGTYVGAVVVLDGSLSYDPNGDPVAFFWTVQGPSGSTATLTNAGTATPTLVPDVPGSYTVTNTVTDAWGLSNAASVMISVATPGNYAEAQAANAVTQVAGLPPASVTSAGNQQALGNFLQQTMSALQNNNVAQAINRLQNAISRTDGCVLRGAPDGNGPGKDWVTECLAQAQLYWDLTAALQAVQP